MSNWFLLLCQFSVIGFALVAGVFLAFSDFLMRSLSKADGHGGVEAMQIINREVFRVVFMALFLGLVPVSAALTVYAIVVLSGFDSALIALSGLTYVAGTFGVTVVFNVPLNEKLAPLDHSLPETERFWRHTYLPRWTFWNSVRTVASVMSSLLLLLGLT